jgi:hypothetical protein
MGLRAVRVAPIEDLLAAYRVAASAHRQASLNGDYRAGNLQADLIARIFGELRRRGREAQERLLEFLGDEDPGVRGWAAAHMLEFAPDRAAQVLEQLVQSEPWPANTSAEMTLKVWRQGELRFP